MDGFGPIVRDENEPLFHHDWERTTFGLLQMVLLEGYFVVDAVRHQIELMGAVRYLVTHYYEHWLFSIEENCIEKRLLTREEIEKRVEQLREKAVSQCP